MIFCDNDGFERMDVDGDNIVLKHPERAEFRVITFDALGSGIPIIKTTKNPVDDSLFAVSLQKKPSEA